MHGVGPRTVAAAIALTLLVCVVAAAGREPLHGAGGGTGGESQSADDVTTAVPKRKGPLPPEVFIIPPEEEFSLPPWVLWTIAGVVLTAVVVGGLLQIRGHRLWGFGRRRARRAPAESAAAEGPSAGPGDDAEVARRAVEAGLESLRDPADPRGAVIAAYARMEQVLAQRELGRRTSEAPREYLGRVLAERGMPERSLTTLTSLFEEARFSLHPISYEASRRALSALENARVALTCKAPRRLATGEGQ
jgi:Domain of unknown function (DUF4129)